MGVQLLRQSTAVTLKLGPFVLNTDGDTDQTGLTISQADVRLSKNGGNMAQKNEASACTHDEIGQYDCPIDTTDTGTLGRLRVMVHESGALHVWDAFMVIPQQVYDSLVLGTDLLDANVAQIDDDATAAANSALQWNGTGVVGGEFPATQTQVSGIAATGSTAKTPARSSPDGFVITLGENEVNTEDATRAVDGVTHDIEAQLSGTQQIDVYYEMQIGIGIPSLVTWRGYLDKGGGAAKKIDVQVHNVDADTWRTIGTVDSGTSIEPHSFDLYTDEVGSGGDTGIARIRFLTGATSAAFSATTKLLTEQIFITHGIGQEGYELGAIWFDSAAGNTSTARGIDGRPSKPVSTMAAVNTLLAKTGLHRVEVAAGSTVTLAATQNNQVFDGINWTLVLAAQNIAGTTFIGADVSGISSGSGVAFEDCDFGAGTYPPGHYHDCGFGEGDGLFTASAAGEYLFIKCNSLVEGIGTPDFNFVGNGASTGIHNRGWFGGAAYVLDADCVISHEVVGGGGTSIVTGGATDVQIRGITRDLTLTLSAAESIQFIGITGVITLSGTTTATVNLGGVSTNVADTTITAIVEDNTVSQDAIDTGHGLLATPAQVAAALVAIHLDHLFAAEYDPASKPGASTALLNELIESDGGVSRYTTNALEQARGTNLAALASAWTSARAGFQDNLNIGENVAGTSQVAGILNNTRASWRIPPVMERPDAGSETITLEIFLYDTDGNMEAPDSAPTIAAVDDTGASRDVNLSSTTMSLVSTGRYSVTYTVASGHAIERVRFTISVVESAKTRLYGGTTQIVDTTAVDFTAADRTKLEELQTVLSAGIVARSNNPTLEELLGVDDDAAEDTLVFQTWEEILTGLTHNVANSSGRIVRELASVIIITGTSPNSGGNTNTSIKIELDGDASAMAGAYDPAGVHIVGGLGAGQSREIWEYGGADKLAWLNRDWKVTPDDTSEYVISAHSGNTHVNEGYARGGGASSITLNPLASSVDNAYKDQTIFLAAGVGADQANECLSYNGTSKIAIMKRPWVTVPVNEETMYAVLPPAHLGPTLAEMDAAHALLATPAQVNAQMLDVMTIDTFAQPGKVAMPATADFLFMIQMIYKALVRNKNIVNTGTGVREIYNDDGITVDQEGTVADDGTIFTEGEVGIGS